MKLRTSRGPYEVDAVLITEAPDEGSRRRCTRALEGFAARFGLRTRRALIGFPSETQQEIAFLYDPDRLRAVHDPQGDDRDPPRFDRQRKVPLMPGAAPHSVRFSRPPLELLVETAAGTYLRLIGVHLKSRAPHGARSPEDALRRAAAARRTQVAQALWLRARIEAHLAAREPLIVLGDLNDGPLADALTDDDDLRPGVAIVTGADAAPPLRLHDPHARAAVAVPGGTDPATALFPDDGDGSPVRVLLDYILVSRDLLPRARRWRIWHPFDDPGCAADPALQAALLAASDHFPVSLDIEV